jgi:Flp pilus assembly protein TadD
VALNRLGRAYEALSLRDQAREAFQQVLELQPGNTIATNRLKVLDRRRRAARQSQRLSVDIRACP